MYRKIIKFHDCNRDRKCVFLPGIQGTLNIAPLKGHNVDQFTEANGRKRLFLI